MFTRCYQNSYIPLAEIAGNATNYRGQVSRRLDYNNPVCDLEGAGLSSYTSLSIENRKLKMQFSRLEIAARYSINILPISRGIMVCKKQLPPAIL
jgi:hypothetical protein